jgi:hypothetical protein
VTSSLQPSSFAANPSRKAKKSAPSYFQAAHPFSSISNPSDLKKSPSLAPHGTPCASTSKSKA